MTRAPAVARIPPHLHLLASDHPRHTISTNHRPRSPLYPGVRRPGPPRSTALPPGKPAPHVAPFFFCYPPAPRQPTAPDAPARAPALGTARLPTPAYLAPAVLPGGKPPTPHPPGPSPGASLPPHVRRHTWPPCSTSFLRARHHHPARAPGPLPVGRGYPLYLTPARRTGPPSIRRLPTAVPPPLLALPAPLRARRRPATPPPAGPTPKHQHQHHWKPNLATYLTPPQAPTALLQQGRGPPNTGQPPGPGTQGPGPSSLPVFLLPRGKSPSPPPPPHFCYRTRCTAPHLTRPRRPAPCNTSSSCTRRPSSLTPGVDHHHSRSLYPRVNRPPRTPAALAALLRR